MGQTSGFFESVVDETGEYDRIYYASQFAKYFSRFVGNGVFADPTDQLKVEALGSGNMSVLVKKGMAFINGYWYELDTNETITLTNASTEYPRWDAIVLRCDMSDRVIQLAVKQGNYDASPTKPSIVQNDETYELCLAYVYVEKEAVEIYTQDITDTRADESICGFVAALIEQLKTSELFAQYQAIFEAWFTDVKTQVRNIVNAVGGDPEGALAGFNLVFDAWFDTIKEKVGEEPATRLQLQIDELTTKVMMYFNGFMSKRTVFNPDGSITATFNDGATIVTVFNDDGSIVATLATSDGLRFVKTTTFTADGSIDEEVV